MIVKEDFFDKIVAVQFNSATEVEEGARVAHQSPVSDTGQLSIVVVVRVPQSAIDERGSVDVLEFGPTPVNVDNPGAEGVDPSSSPLTRSRITVSSDTVEAVFVGAAASQTVRHCFLDDGSGTFTATLTTSKDSSTFTNVLHFGSVPPWANTHEATVKIPGFGSRFFSVLSWTTNNDNPDLKIGDCTIDITGPNGVTTGTKCDFTVHSLVGDNTGESSDEEVAFQLAVSCGGNGFIPDKWNIIFVSADVSLPVSVGAPAYDVFNSFPVGPPEISSTHKMYIAVNQKDYSSQKITLSYGSVQTEPGAVLPSRYSAFFPQDFKWEGSPYDSVPGPPAGVDVCSVGPSTPAENVYHLTDMNVAGWEFAIGGEEFALPVQATEGLTPTGPVEYGPVRVWAGQTLNFSDPAVRAKFVSTKGKLLPLKVANEAFGPPVYSLSGAPTRFVSNKGGTVGSLAAIGALRAYPYPKKIG